LPFPRANFLSLEHWQPMPPKEATYRCALCGPSSLHGDRKEKDCECHASRSGFKKWDHDVYVSCSRCGSKMSIECLDALSAKVDELDYPLHDPEGVWEALLERPWASDRHDDPPLQGWCDNHRSLGPCILCEQGVLVQLQLQLLLQLRRLGRPGQWERPGRPLRRQAVATTPVMTRRAMARDGSHAQSVDRVCMQQLSKVCV
jgi:hypothetical protein